MKIGNPYSTVMFCPKAMRKVVSELVRVLPHYMRQYDFNTIAVTGKSGTALGFAVAMLVPGLRVVAVRKGESSHGDMVEGAWDNDFSRYAFFDDFVASGDTYRRVVKEINRKADSQQDARPECVLIIEYATRERSTKIRPSVDAPCPRLGVQNVDHIADAQFYVSSDPSFTLAYHNAEGFANTLTPV